MVAPTIKTLRQRRLEHGWTMLELGQRVDPARPVTPGVIGDWELVGSCQPRRIPQLAVAFGITPAEAREMMEETKRQADALKQAASAAE